MIKIGIVGYGNLGKSVEKIANTLDDFEIVGIFTRREPSTVKSSSNVYSYENISDFIGKIDVILLCGGSKEDILVQGPQIHKLFNTVDCFDTHKEIPAYYKEMEKIGIDNNTLALVSTGWDPGLFSLQRVLFESILGYGKTYTFWGEGVSQGHSEAVRKIYGVKKAIQYTVPIKQTITEVRNGSNKDYATNQKHKRICYVVADENNHKKIEKEIKQMPNYFADYDTKVYFISEEEFDKNHTKLNHGGFVIRNGNTGDNVQNMEFSLKLDSNPDFTATTAISYARAVYKLNKEGINGALTLLDVPISYLSNKTKDELLEMI